MNDSKFYENIITSREFNENLKILNKNLKDELEKNRYLPTLIGNLFYDHEQINPPFYNSDMIKDCNEKRIRFVNACKNRNCMFEIGLNGGHSSFLSLMSNNKLVVYSNDIAEFYPPCPNIHPEIYVPVAANTLQKMFHNRFTFIKGNCLKEVPIFIKDNPTIKFDLVHIDGAKETYKQDFLNIIPNLENNALIIFDDTQQPAVQNTVDELISKKYLFRDNNFPQISNKIKYRNEILNYKKQ